uniref:Uncharacterized protein n=1 Tax=Anopheles maculatus TaxID=74869 RepID=A0A182SKB7_9DIPT
MKQWEREKATLLAEQKELAKLDVVGDEIVQKRNEMLARKYGEIATLLIGIGEGVEKTDELRMKLAEFTKQRRDELHDYQSSDSDMRSEEARKDGRLGGENGRDGNSSPMFDTIDWNLGSVSMDLRLDLPFKNPNDFPDILTRLSSINTGNYQLKSVTNRTIAKGDKQTSGKGSERKQTPQQKGSKLAFTGKKPSSEQPPNDVTVAKKSKMNDSSHRTGQVIFGNENENGNSNDDRETPVCDNVFVTPKPLSKKNNYDKMAANGQAKVSRKTPALAAQRDKTPVATPRSSSPVEKRSSPTPKGTGDDKKVQENRVRSSAIKAPTGLNNNRTPNNQSKGRKDLQSTTNQQQHHQQRVHQEKNYIAHQKQPEQPKRARSKKMLSPVVNSLNPSKNVQKQSSIASGSGDDDSGPPVSMEMDAENIQGVESMPSNSSLDFGMQSSSSEFDMNLSGELQPDLDASNENIDDDLDFLSIKPERVTRSKKQKKKHSNGGKGNNSNDGDMDSFDFTFGGTNSNESLEQQEDLF